ncbi:DUF6340 family protein [Mangrovibacterium marinum]|uniref:Tetratricopeptide repeat protein n=1 Tax=Mangrovibacterium marinum TaxID=1639118 RepID=A0A2T5C3K6_9BACT|nr:DUF6340 family protein [Mangrovibacterium marinum]PTN09337.1 hypothetical protein C8N47_105178 [Mangrovibacterium marinum]
MKLFKHNKLIFWLFALLLSFSSCTSSYKSLVIETAQPSTHLLPEDIHSLTLVNRSITADFQDFDKDSLQQFFFSRGFRYDSVVLDSLAADTTLKALGELLFESGRYDVVIPEQRFLERHKEFYLVPEKLDWTEVSALCEEFDTDALLVIERYFNKIMTDYKTFNDSNGDAAYASASIDSKYDVVVKIYDPVRQEIIRQLVVDDTISWRDGGYSTEKIFDQLPLIKECLIQTGVQAALELDDKLSPNWVKENRIFFVINDTDASQIALLAHDNKWQEAYDYWLQYAESAKTSVKSKAEFNLALASEMLGDIDLAIEWANKSYFTRYMQQTQNYLLTLKKRQEILARFNQ